MKKVVSTKKLKKTKTNIACQPQHLYTIQKLQPSHKRNNKKHEAEKAIKCTKLLNKKSQKLSPSANGGNSMKA
jgi:hypothetical protein